MTRPPFKAILRAGALSCLLLAGLPAGLDVASAQSQRLVVVVNDNPITNYDINQRVKLNRVLGIAAGSQKQQRQRALRELINDVITRSEAKRLKLEFKKEQVDRTIEGMAKGVNLTMKSLNAKLRSNGISEKTFRRQVEDTLVFRYLMRRKYNVDVEVTDAEVDRRYSKYTSDPRLKPVRIFEIREIDLPLGNASEAMRSQLEYARAVEAQQIMKRYKGCNSARKAASGIFNVKVGKIVQAPADKLPAQMRKVLLDAGTKRLIGPMRGPKGIRLIGYCGQRTLSPPKPPREAIKNMLLNEKYQKASERVMRDLRRRAFIDFKDKSAVIN
jgi:peptidyl-prolyl cis-trans isomerase SurA